MPRTAAHASTPKADVDHILAEVRKMICGESAASKVQYAGTVAGPNGSYVLYARLPDDGCIAKGQVS